MRITIAAAAFLFICLAGVQLSACTPRSTNKQAKQSSSTASPIVATSPGTSESTYDSNQTDITRQDAIDNHWDEIKQNLNGTETINACSDESGNCYDLDADISEGSINQIHFANGGSLDFSADIDETGSASDSDVNGNGWTFTVDMSSSLVDSAVEEWAQNNGYTVQ